MDDDDGAYNAFYKATWNSAWQDSAYFSIAQIDVARGDFENALEHISWAIDRNARNMKAYALKASILRKLGNAEGAIDTANLSLSRDAFNLSALFEKILACRSLGRDAEASQLKAELIGLGRGTAHNFIEYSLDYAAAGLYDEASELLSFILQSDTSPLVYYYLAYWNQKLGKPFQENLEKAKNADSYLCFPNRLEDIPVLKYALEANAGDAKAPYYLGNLFYDKRQYQEAIDCWELSLQRDASFPTVYRNLAIAYFNKLQAG
jgi:tetratricopeptide (TPR) repeat protein